MQNESSSATQAPAIQSHEPSLSAQPFTLVAEPVPETAHPDSDLHQLLGAGPYRLKEERALIQCRTVEPATNQGLQSSSCESVISATPSANPLLRQRMRNGKIARLPKLERDLVNKLLHNHVPYSKIVWALPYRPPGPTFGELFLRQTSELLNSRRAVVSPSPVAQPASSGSPPVTQRKPTVTHGNLR